MDADLSSLDYVPISPENYTNANDFVVELGSFDENHASKVIQSSDAGRKEIELLPDPLNYSEQRRETSKLEVMNDYIHTPDYNKSSTGNEDMYQVSDELNLATELRDFMRVKKKRDELREKVAQSEKEKADLQLKVDILKAEKYQFTHLEEERREINKLQKEISNVSEDLKKMRNDIKSRKHEMSGLNKTKRKLEEDDENLRDLLMQFLHRLENADLLSMKYKNIKKKLMEGNLVLEEAFDSEDEERKDISLVANTSTDAKQSRDFVKNETKDLESGTPQVSRKDSTVENPTPHSPNLTPMGFFSMGIPETAGVCDSSVNIAGPSRTHYGCL